MSTATGQERAGGGRSAHVLQELRLLLCREALDCVLCAGGCKHLPLLVSVASSVL